MILLSDGEGSDQTAQMRRFSWAFAVRICPKTRFHNLIKEKLNDLIEWTFHREDSLYLACNVRNAFFTSEVHKNYTLWTCQKVCEALTFLLDNIYIKFGTQLCRQIVGIPMCTNCAPLWLICSCVVIKETSWCLFPLETNLKSLKLLARLLLDDLLNIDNTNFDGLISQIYPHPRTSVK